MEITLEKVDEIVRRKKVSYFEAKQALEDSNGDVVEALSLLDSRKPRQRGLLDKIKDGVARLHRIKLVVEKDEDVLVQLPGTIVTLILLFAFPFSIAAIIIAFLLGCRFRLKNNGQDMAINKELDKVSDSIEKMKE